MKSKLLLFMFLIGSGLVLRAQNDIFVTSFKWLENDVSAITHETVDGDSGGQKCALIKVETTETGFTFDFDWTYPTKIETHVGEIWVYVRPGVDHVMIRHPRLGSLDEEYYFPEEIMGGRTYRMKLNAVGVGPKTPMQQYLVFQIRPLNVNAYIEVDGNSWNVLSDGSASNIVELGSHDYRVVAPGYFTEEGSVTVADHDNTVSVKVDLKPNSARVTLKVDADAEIWVNDEKKGVRTWTGVLNSGTYKIECKQANHRTSMTIQKITPANEGQTITLSAPEPIYGSLKIESTPIEAKIYINEKYMGVTPKWLKEVLVGDYELCLEKEGCAPSCDNIRVEEGKELKLKKELDTGRNVLVKTDRAGDKIYVDGKYVGETPRVTPLGFGKHTIRVKRGKNELDKQIEITINTKNDQELFFEFGRLITIYTDQVGDKIYVDGEEVGSSPVSIDLDFGEHTIYARRGKKYADKDIKVLRNGGLTEHRLELHRETATDYVKNGVWFSTLNAAASYSGFNQPSYGATIGYVKKAGFFLSAMSNFNFDAKNASLTCDSQGLVDGEYPEYTGKSSDFRFSVLGGLVANGFNDGSPSPFSFRFGAGYGVRTRCLEIADGRLVKVADNCFSGLDLTAGIQFNIKGFTMSLDAVSSQFESFEMNIGLGYCWKHK